MAGISTFSTKDLDFFYYSDRAKVDGKVVSHLVQFISTAKHTLDVAIYDLKNKEVFTALKKISSKVQLTIIYAGGVGGKHCGGRTTIVPKNETPKRIIAPGLKNFADPTHTKPRNRMP